MPAVKRSPRNPILLPDPKSPWEAVAAHNPSVVRAGGLVHLLYRAVSAKQKVEDKELELSSVGHAAGKDGITFSGRTQLVAPQEEWERYGCEDPRVTEFEGKFYIFYTAVRDFNADGIKVAVAVTRDFKTIDERHLVTPFNAKAMALFPGRVGGKVAAVLTVHTDRPPGKICLALFDRIEDVWSASYWEKWYADWKRHVIPIEENEERDQIEVGSAPVKTKDGWLLFYSYIYNYRSPPAIFGVQAILLRLDDPKKIVGEVKRPFLVPETEYEYYGRVPHVVFPSGALIKKNDVSLYYGAADTVSCVATMGLRELLAQLTFTAKRDLIRFEGNPIIAPIKEHAWEAKATFNPAAIYEDGKVRILYRALSEDNTSTIGYATAVDGVHVTKRLPEPIYVPREDFERKLVPGGNSGCEDPRVTVINDRIYMCYTAYDGKDPPRVAFTSIGRKDFSDHNWNWTKPVLISPPGVDDKDAVLFPKKIGGKYWFLHRPHGTDIWIDAVADLDFDGRTKFLGGQVLMQPRGDVWDSRRIGGAAPPIETEYGWLVFYHGISRRTGHYNIRAALLDLKYPSLVLYRTHDPLLEPEMPYEREGIVSNVVFPCGAVMIKGQLYVYYGGADKFVGVATLDMKVIVRGLAREARSEAEG
jgi:beta-1,2-mannobiose phosphorylase / 1,2-beta-oligomannan phosphorylase